MKALIAAIALATMLAGLTAARAGDYPSRLIVWDSSLCAQNSTFVTDQLRGTIRRMKGYGTVVALRAEPDFWRLRLGSAAKSAGRASSEAGRWPK
jgi:hypothetical protein